MRHIYTSLLLLFIISYFKVEAQTISEIKGEPVTVINLSDFDKKDMHITNIEQVYSNYSTYILTIKGKRYLYAHDYILFPEFQKISENFKQLGFVVKNGDAYNVIDTNGNLRIKNKYLNITHATDSFFIVNKENKYAISTYDDKIVLPFQNDRINYFFPNNPIIGTVNKEGTENFILKSGKALPSYISKIIALKNGSVIKNDEKYRVITNNGIISAEFESIYILNSDGISKPEIMETWKFARYDYDVSYFLPSLNGKLGLMNLDGKMLLKPDYSKIELFGNIISLTSDTGKKIYFPLKRSSYPEFFKEIKTANDKVICTKSNMLSGIINQDGNIIIPFEYEYIEKLIGIDFYYVTKNKKVGIINFKGKVIVPIEYDNIKEFSNKGFKFSLNGTDSFWNLQGEIIEQTQDLKDTNTVRELHK